MLDLEVRAIQSDPAVTAMPLQLRQAMPTRALEGSHRMRHTVHMHRMVIMPHMHIQSADSLAIHMGPIRM